jgi:hypothetical protein
MKLALVVALSLGIGGTVSASSQLDCPAQLGEDEEAREARCTREASLETYGHQLKTQQEFAEVRASLMRQPALTPAKNPLLGRWSLPKAGQGGSDDAVSQIFGAIGSLANCGPLVGASQIEFLPDNMVSLDEYARRSPAAATYRSGKGGVFALTSQYVLFFKFLAPNRVQLGGLDECKLARMGDTASAPTAAAPAPARTAAPPPVTRLAGPSRVIEGAAFRCAGAKVVVVKYCGNGADPYCQIWTALDRHPPDAGFTPSTSRSEIERRVQGCELGTVSMGADAVVTFLPSP